MKNKTRVPVYPRCASSFRRTGKRETARKKKRGNDVDADADCPLPSLKSVRSIFVGFRSTFKADGQRRGEGVLACNDEEKNP